VSEKDERNHNIIAIFEQALAEEASGLIRQIKLRDEMINKLTEVLEKSKTFIESVADLSTGKIKFDAERLCREIDEALSEHLNRFNQTQQQKEGEN
jgi:hypothetical protein